MHAHTVFQKDLRALKQRTQEMRQPQINPDLKCDRFGFNGAFLQCQEKQISVRGHPGPPSSLSLGHSRLGAGDLGRRLCERPVFWDGTVTLRDHQIVTTQIGHVLKTVHGARRPWKAAPEYKAATQPADRKNR